jgi:DNA-binding transcriptional regulator LsrR (DeoR family)
MDESSVFRPVSHSRTESAHIVEVARLYYGQNVKQPEIATRLKIPQATVSRLLKRAIEEGIVKYVISPPPLMRIQADILAKVRSKGISDVRVTPQGIGETADKNVENLGAAGAEYLRDLVSLHQGDRLTISMACGETLLATLLHFVADLERDPGARRILKEKEIILYPLNLFWGPKLEYDAATYPSVLVIATATLLSRLGCRVLAYAPQLPLSFYSHSKILTADDLNHQIVNYRQYLDESKQADIFLIGIGRGPQDLRIKRVLDVMKMDIEYNEGYLSGEVNYQPFDNEGNFIKLPKFIGVTCEELRSLSEKDKKVIAIAGGKKKMPAITTLLNNIPPFNILITDKSVADNFLEVSKDVA